jgi:hypothetical protein
MRLFLRHKKRITLDPVKHRRRDVLLTMKKGKMKHDDDHSDQLTYCYENIRCPLYHEASDMTVTDVMLDDFQETVCFLIREMFGIDCAQFVAEGVLPEASASVPGSAPTALDITNLKKVDAIVLALGMQPQKESSAILAHLRSLGYTERLTTSVVSAYLSRGGYFYKDPTDATWKLTEFVGKQRYRQITEVT